MSNFLPSVSRLFGVEVYLSKSLPFRRDGVWHHYIQDPTNSGRLFVSQVCWDALKRNAESLETSLESEDE